MFYAMKCLFFCFPYQANPYAFVACTIASRVLTAAPESIVFAASAMPSAILSAFSQYTKRLLHSKAQSPSLVPVPFRKEYLW